MLGNNYEVDMTDISFFESLASGKSNYYVFNDDALSVGSTNSTNTSLVLGGDKNAVTKKPGWRTKHPKVTKAIAACLMILCGAGLTHMASSLFQSTPPQDQVAILELLDTNQKLATTELSKASPELMSLTKSAGDMAGKAAGTAKDIGTKAATSVKRVGIVAKDKASDTVGGAKQWLLDKFDNTAQEADK